MRDAIERAPRAPSPPRREVPDEIMDQDQFVLALFLLAGSPDFFHNSELRVDRPLGELQPARVIRR